MTTLVGKYFKKGTSFSRSVSSKYTDTCHPMFALFADMGHVCINGLCGWDDNGEIVDRKFAHGRSSVKNLQPIEQYVIRRKSRTVLTLFWHGQKDNLLLP